MAAASCFVYGSLLAPEVLLALLGRVPTHKPALLRGFRRYALRDRAYPGVVRVPEACVHGNVLLGLAPREAHLLDLFEDEYTSEAVSVEVEGESLPTKVYVWRLATFANPEGLLLGDWDYAAWRRDQLEGFLAMTREYAAQLDRDETRTCASMATHIVQRSSRWQSQDVDVHAALLQSRGAQLVVINPGSARLRVGRAAAEAPVEVDHVVAYQHTGASASTPRATEAAVDDELEMTCRQVEASLQLPAGQQPGPQSASHIAMDACPSPSWTDLGGGDARLPRAVFGDAAARLAPRDAARYAVVWPMRGGQLDVRPDQPLSVVLSAVEDIWRWTLNDQLQMTPAEVLASSCVLVAPLSLCRRSMHELATLALCRLGFHSLVIHTEPHAMACACGVTTACVVSIGAQACHIACVDEGTLLPAPHVVLPIGMDDVVAGLPALARRGGGVWPDAEVPQHGLATLLAAACHLPSASAPGRPDAEPEHVVPVATGQATGTSRVALGSASLLAPSALVTPALRVRRPAVHRLPLPPNAHDTLDEAFWAASVGAAAPAVPGPTAMVGQPTWGLDDAIAECISLAAAQRPELRIRLCACVLLAGGGAALSGLAEALTERLTARLNAQAQESGETAVNVFAVRPHPQLAAWRGGALLAALDTSRDAWPRREAWKDGVFAGKPGRYDAAVTPISRLATYVL